MTSMLDSLNRTTTYQYLDNETDKPTLVRTPSVYSSQYRDVETIYNVDDLPETIEISGYTPSGTAVSRSIQLDYNSYGQITEIDGPRTDVSDVTTFDYYECTTGDGCGQLESVTNALGHETTFDSYDDNGRLLQMTSPNNVVVTYTYDLRGRVLTFAETPPSGPARTTSFAYDDAGQLETVEAPNGTELTYEYDAAHNLISITDNAGNTIEYDHDLNGNITDEDVRDSSQTLTRTVEYAYDARNRVDYINAGGSSVTALVYDAVGNLTEETDPNVNDTEHDYDAFNRLIETLDALSGATEYGYDKNDYLASVEAPNGATTTYSYDDLGNLLSFTSPDTGTTTYTYDAAGNRLTQTDANNVTVEYEYDALNRLVSIEYPDSSLDVTFSYDGGTNQKGRLTQMADGTGTTTFSYDVFGNLTQESKSIDSDTHVTAYTYDEADLLESITYPSGRTVDYTRNVLGQITEVETTYDSTTVTVVDQVTYEPFGALNGLTFGNSLAMSRDFDQRYVMTGQTAGSIQDLVYTLDSAGNIDAVDDDVDPSLDQTFTQDALHRITQDIGDYGTKSYTYDGVGNRLTRVHGANTQTLTYTSNSNRLATHDGLSVTQDSAGNTTADATQNVSFTYRDHNRMSTASVGGVLQADYRYNGHGQRVKKLEATGSSRKFIYHYGVNGELIGESVYNSGGTLIEEHDYIWLETLPLAQAEQTFSGGMLSGNTLVYIHADQLNTPRLATDGSGTVVWRWDSDGFGIGAADLDPDSDTNEVNVRLRFPGQHLDEETGLHYNYFRDYDPVTGRYVESDPIGLDGGLNTYLYANGNPLRFTDPFGLDVKVVTSDPAAAKILMDAYARLTSTRAGMLMCDSLEKSPEVYQIKPITKDAFYCPPGTTDPVCHGDERTVFIDPYNNIFLPTTAGMQETPKAVVLGHELGHARGVRDDGPNAMNNVNAHENPVRRALGLPERSAYYLTSPPVWVPGTR
jgi:RHS repeat-associated protein